MFPWDHHHQRMKFQCYEQPLKEKVSYSTALSDCYSHFWSSRLFAYFGQLEDWTICSSPKSDRCPIYSPATLSSEIASHFFRVVFYLNLRLSSLFWCFQFTDWYQWWYHSKHAVRTNGKRNGTWQFCCNFGNDLLARLWAELEQPSLSWRMCPCRHGRSPCSDYYLSIGCLSRYEKAPQFSKIPIGSPSL